MTDGTRQIVNRLFTRAGVPYVETLGGASPAVNHFEAFANVREAQAYLLEKVGI